MARKFYQATQFPSQSMRQFMMSPKPHLSSVMVSQLLLPQKHGWGQKDSDLASNDWKHFALLMGKDLMGQE
jgi:hypothetical protein